MMLLSVMFNCSELLCIIHMFFFFANHLNFLLLDGLEDSCVTISIFVSNNALASILELGFT